jgi:hypothetical protein
VSASDDRLCHLEESIALQNLPLVVRKQCEAGFRGLSELFGFGKFNKHLYIGEEEY